MAAVGRLTLPSRKVSGSPVYKHIEFVRNAETLWAQDRVALALARRPPQRAVRRL